MFSTAEKTSSHSTPVQKMVADGVFFRKAGEESYFGAKESPSFFGPTVQAKLSVSHPDDPQEREADAMADRVMRMAEPATPVERKDEQKLHRKEDEEQLQA